MTLCIDASIFVRCLTRESGNDRALTWLRSRIREELVAPPFLPFEFGSALLRKLSGGEMTLAECQEALSLFEKLGIRYDQDPHIMRRAFELSFALAQPTVYDTSYLAVAEKHECELWTLDRRFASIASKDHPCVRLLELD